MTQELWTSVDRYFTDMYIPSEPVLDAVLDANAKAGLPDIQVSPTQGKFLHLMVKILGARTVLEIGALGGYSAIWMAWALPENGRVITLEANPKHAEIARTNIDRAGLNDMVDLRIGKALELLPKVAVDISEPFDLVFIDADKQSNSEYFDWALKLSRPGSVIIVDNVVRDGAVLDDNSNDAAIQGIRRFNERVAREPMVSATAIPTADRKGYDGFALIRVNTE